MTRRPNLFGFLVLTLAIVACFVTAVRAEPASNSYEFFQVHGFITDLADHECKFGNILNPDVDCWVQS